LFNFATFNEIGLSQTKLTIMRTKKIIALLTFWLLIAASIQAQPDRCPPFDGGENSFRINAYDSKSITVQFPFYDENSCVVNNKLNTSDRYINLRQGATLSYSIDGGKTFNELLHVYSDNQKTDSWYWIKAKTANTNVRIWATSPAPGYGTADFNHNGFKDWKLSSVYISCDYKKNASKVTYAAFRWEYGNMIQNKAVIFKLTGNLKQNGITEQPNFTWYSPTVVVGNPLHAPKIDRHEFLSDGRVKFSVSVPGFTTADDVGTYNAYNKNGLYL
jgi:hypothetical protein